MKKIFKNKAKGTNFHFIRIFYFLIAFYSRLHLHVQLLSVTGENLSQRQILYTALKLKAP